MKSKTKTVVYSGGEVSSAKVIPNPPKNGFFRMPSEGRGKSKSPKKKLIVKKKVTEIWDGEMLLDIILRRQIGYSKGKELRVTCLNRIPNIKDVLQILQTLFENPTRDYTVRVTRSGHYIEEDIEIEMESLSEIDWRNQ